MAGYDSSEGIQDHKKKLSHSKWLSSQCGNRSVQKGLRARARLTSIHQFSNPFCYQLVKCLVRGCANWAVRGLMELDDSAQKPCSLSIPAVLLLKDVDLTAELLVFEWQHSLLIRDPRLSLLA